MLGEYKYKLEQEHSLVLTVKVKAGAGKSGFAEGLGNGALKINLKARPEHGKANTELAGLLAKKFGVAREDVIIIKGKRTSVKVVKITQNGKKT